MNAQDKIDLLNGERKRVIDTYNLNIDPDETLGLMHDRNCPGVCSDTLVYSVSYAIDFQREGPDVVKTRMLNAFKDLRHLMDMNINKLELDFNGNSFGRAMEFMRDGKAVRLSHWKTDVSIRIQIPDANSKMTHPYFYVTSIRGMVPWIPTMVEMFSTEWEIAE